MESNDIPPPSAATPRPSQATWSGSNSLRGHDGRLEPLHVRPNRTAEKRRRAGRRKLTNAQPGSYFDNGSIQHLSRTNDPFTDGGGLSQRGATLPNRFRGAGYARQSAVQFGRMTDGRPIHLRIGGPGFDAMDTTTGRNTPKLRFSGFFPTADFFAAPRRHRAFPLIELT